MVAVVPRQLTVLGTASQAPTRDRNHNGYLMRWDALGVLFDPGEGTQRQLLLAGERSSTITHIAITHRHGDHLLGLPGVLARMALDQRQDPVTLIHPQEATASIDHLLAVQPHDPPMPLQRHVLPDGEVSEVPLDDGTTLLAVPLDHRVPALGYRVQEADGYRVAPDRLAATGLQGPAVGQLLREGSVDHDGRTVHRDDVAVPRPGQSMAFVMDTRECDGISHLLSGCDLAVIEATFQDGDEALATRFGHLTASQAGRYAGGAGVRRLVLTHFSQRYDGPDGFLAQAGRHHGDVVAAADLDRIEVPARLPVGEGVTG
ncbi:ribonuclease Z [soil metagenome]